MNYKELHHILKHYQRKWKRKWFRADYMAYWKRAKNGIELRVGWRCTSPNFGTGERVLLLYPDGRVTISCNVGMPYERARLNHYFPFNKKWHFWWKYDALMISRIKENQSFWDTVGDDKAIVIQSRYYKVKAKKGDHIRSRYIEFDKDGEPVKPLKGMKFKTHKRKHTKQMNKQNAPRKRGWYWTRRARNLYRNNTSCKASDMTIPYMDRIRCAALGSGWQRQPPTTWACGCITYRKTYKRPFSKKVKEILDEPNATVRAAWMQIYGIQKFFIDAGSRTIDHHGNYKLLRLNTGPGYQRHHDDDRTLVALKMECPSTKTIYINSVPDNITSVSQALDWMYDYPGYLNNVGQQT